jgi:hypothetical protein
LKEYQAKGKGFQCVIKSKMSDRSISNGEGLKGVRRNMEKLNILNLEPFDEDDIIRRGLLQLLKMRERRLTGSGVSQVITSKF